MFLIQYFRMISFIEGLSLVALFFIAIPLRNYMEMYSAVSFTGTMHGILFLTYFLLSLAASHVGKWSVKFWLLTLLTSVIPFGFIYMDKKLKAQEMVEAPASI